MGRRLDHENLMVSTVLCLLLDDFYVFDGIEFSLAEGGGR